MWRAKSSVDKDRAFSDVYVVLTGNNYWPLDTQDNLRNVGNY